MRYKAVAVALSIIFATSMTSSQSAFAGGPCLFDSDCTSPSSCQTGGECGKFVIGICGYDNLSDGTTCGSSATSCSGQDTCQGGSCVANHFAVGTSCGGSNPNPCLDACNGFGTCIDDAPGSGGSCDDEAVCTGNDVCVVGVCVGDPIAANGVSCGNSDSSQCDLPDTCLAGFCEPNLLTGNSCDDEKECTANDTCVSGACVGNILILENLPCGDTEDTDCKDPDKCAAGVCIPNDPPSGASCDNGDGEQCTGVCDGFGTCTDGPQISGPCDDGFACTGPDACFLGQCVGASKNNDCCTQGFPDNEGGNCGDGPVECSSQDACSDGTCEPNDHAAGTSCGDPTNTACNLADTCTGDGICSVNLVSAGTSCEDGDTCTGPDTCDETGTCIVGPPLDIPACFPDDGVVVGGKVISIESTNLILAGAQSFSWMIPVTLSVLGIGLFAVSRKSEN